MGISHKGKAGRREAEEVVWDVDRLESKTLWLLKDGSGSKWSCG